LKTLCGLPREAATVEFKSNLAQPEEFGQYLSALANSATLEEHSRAWLVWGLDDGSHTVLRTTFDPLARKSGEAAGGAGQPPEAEQDAQPATGHAARRPPRKHGLKAAPIWNPGASAGFATGHAPSKA